MKLFKQPMSQTTQCDHEYTIESIAIRQGNNDFKTIDVVVREKCIDCGYVKQTIHSNMVQTTPTIFLPLDEFILIEDKEITIDDVKTLSYAKTWKEWNWIMRDRGIHPESENFESGVGNSTKESFRWRRNYLKKCYNRDCISTSHFKVLTGDQNE